MTRGWVNKEICSKILYICSDLLCFNWLSGEQVNEWQAIQEREIYGDVDVRVEGGENIRCKNARLLEATVQRGGREGSSRNKWPVGTYSSCSAHLPGATRKPNAGNWACAKPWAEWRFISEWLHASSVTCTSEPLATIQPQWIKGNLTIYFNIVAKTAPGTPLTRMTQGCDKKLYFDENISFN